MPPALLMLQFGKKEDFHLAARVGMGMLLEMEQAGDGQVVACLAKQGSPMQPS